MSAALVAALALAAAPRATARTAEPPRYVGATLALSLQAGTSFLADERVSGRAGFSTGVAARFTSPLYLLDVEIAYRLTRFSGDVAGAPLGVLRQGFSSTVGLHPFFIALLGNRWIHYVLGAAHLDIGASLEVTRVSGGSFARTRGDPAWHWGAGLELPLGNPDTGTSWWLGLRFRQVRLRTDLAPSLATELGDSQVFLSLAYHWNWK